MYLLRRTAARALSAPSKTLFVKPAARNITYNTPAFQSRLPLSHFQRRFASDDVTSKAAEETSTAAANETAGFAQTASETAPIEENMTPAQSEAEQAEPTDAQNTVNASAFEAVAREQSRGERSPRDSFRRGTPAPPNKTLYVGNLYYEVTPDQLERIFSRFGEVVSVNVVKDNRGMSRGFAYVEYSNLDDAQNAISNLNQQVFEGRNLIVQPHVQKERPGRTYEPKEPNAPSKTLFIGNMSFNMTDKDLNDLFREIRNVVDVRVAIDRRTGQPRGFAHADFVDVASAVKAFETLQGKSFHGRELRLDYTQSATRAPRTDRSENGGNRFHDRRDNDRRDNNRQGGFGRE